MQVCCAWIQYIDAFRSFNATANPYTGPGKSQDLLQYLGERKKAAPRQQGVCQAASMGTAFISSSSVTDSLFHCTLPLLLHKKKRGKKLWGLEAEPVMHPSTISAGIQEDFEHESPHKHCGSSATRAGQMLFYRTSQCTQTETLSLRSIFRVLWGFLYMCVYTDTNIYL